MSNLPCQIIDLDSVIVSGNNRYCAPYKRGNREFSFGGIQYLMEIISNGYMNNSSIIVLCRDIQLCDTDTLEDDLMSYREPETLMQYELCYEKLSMTGVKVKFYKTQQELWDDLFALTKQAAFETPLARVYTNHLTDIAGLINKHDTLYLYTSSKVFTCVNATDVVDDIVIPYNTYDLYELLRPYIHNRELLQYLLEYYKTSIDNMCYKTPARGAWASIEHYRSKKFLTLFLDMVSALSERDVKEITKAIEAKFERENNLPKYKLEAYKGINEKGMAVFLYMMRFPMIAEYLKLDTKPKVGQSDYNYVQNKVDKFFRDEYSLDNNISLTTDFFSQEEKIVLKHTNGKLEHDLVFKDDGYLEDQDADDFLADFRG